MPCLRNRVGKRTVFPCTLVKTSMTTKMEPKTIYIEFQGAEESNYISLDMKDGRKQMGSESSSPHVITVDDEGIP